MKLFWNVIKFVVDVTFIAYVLITVVGSRLAPGTSIDAFKKASHYNGDVCLVEVDTHNKPYCSNHVKYTPSSVNAGTSYDIWVACQKDSSLHLCKGDI